MATAPKEKSIRISPDHGRKLDKICRLEGRMRYRQIELYVDADFETRRLSLEDAPDASGNGKDTD